MKTFKITVDLSKIYQAIKPYKLREYAGSFPVLELNAHTPDQACYLTYNNLRDLLKNQDGMTEAILLDVRRLMSIKKIEIKND